MERGEGAEPSCGGRRAFLSRKEWCQDGAVNSQCENWVAMGMQGDGAQAGRGGRGRGPAVPALGVGGEGCDRSHAHRMKATFGSSLAST